VQLAALYQSTDRVEASQKLIEEIWKMLQDDVDSGHNMNMEYAHIYLDLVGDYNKALEYTLKEYKKRPNNIDVNKLAAISYYKMGAYQKAQTHIDKASVTNTKNPELLLVKGLTIEKLGDKKTGNQFIKIAMDTNPYLSNCLTMELTDK
jgi:tetratricopeptide (TPR) repeat protein